MAEESLQSPDRPAHFRVEGDGGKLPAAIATPLAVVLTELFQNAVDHAFTAAAAPCKWWCCWPTTPSPCPSRWSTTAPGCRRASPRHRHRLGLSIVRTLVTTELGGTSTSAGHDDDLTAAGLPAGNGRDDRGLAHPRRRGRQLTQSGTQAVTAAFCVAT
jgi:two-component sensor histidine kinase